MDTNPYTYKIPSCSGNRYVIPDIHGCLATFLALLNKINIQKNDQLFLLGDYIDRGLSSLGVVDTIIQYMNNGYQFFPLLGNHEEELLLIHRLKSKKYILDLLEGEDIHNFFNKDYKLKDEYLSFFSSLPYYYELDAFFLVHAGFDFDSPKPFEDTVSMIDIRYWSYNKKRANNKTIIFGHTPEALNEIESHISRKDKMIPLDNGCVFKELEGLGKLLCLNLDNLNLTIQPNIELF